MGNQNEKEGETTITRSQSFEIMDTIEDVIQHEVTISNSSDNKKAKKPKEEKGNRSRSKDDMDLTDNSQENEIIVNVPRKKRDMTALITKQAIEIRSQKEMMHHGKIYCENLVEENENGLRRLEERDQLIASKDETIKIFRAKNETLKSTNEGIQNELREKENLYRRKQNEVLSFEKQIQEANNTINTLYTELEVKKAEIEEIRRQCSEEECARRRLEEDRQLMRDDFVKHINEIENQRYELRRREERLQASEQRYQDEHCTRVNLEDQLRCLRFENDELRCSIESTENELVQELRRRQEESDSFAQERQSYEQRLRESLSSLADSERRIQELQTTVNNSQSILDEHRRIEPRDWIIRREEVTLTDVSLGNGAWGTVKVGIFRSSNVAVKQIHELILSPHNRRLFEREMSIAARCRHPCLLQFIGATNDDGVPLFITELLDVNLRAVLSRRSLHQEEIITIALDVASALNYLHLSKPFPIIHRDISSSNVLLWKRDACWRAKVSDYGAANFMRQCMTENPGAGIYAAPEASTSQQSPKLDVYSFGLLLCELCTRELPVPQQTQEQITLVTNGMLRELIIRCVRVDPETRPTMADIITSLEEQQVVSINGWSAAL